MAHRRRDFHFPAPSCYLVSWLFCFICLSFRSLVFGFYCFYSSLPASGLSSSFSISSLSELRHAPPGSDPFLGELQRTLTISKDTHRSFDLFFVGDFVVSELIELEDVLQMHFILLSGVSSANPPLPRAKQNHVNWSPVLLRSAPSTTSSTSSRHVHCMVDLYKERLGFNLLGWLLYGPLFLSWAVSCFGGPSHPAFISRFDLLICLVNSLFLLSRYNFTLERGLLSYKLLTPAHDEIDHQFTELKPTMLMLAQISPQNQSIPMSPFSEIIGRGLRSFRVLTSIHCVSGIYNGTDFSVILVSWNRLSILPYCSNGSGVITRIHLSGMPLDLLAPLMVLASVILCYVSSCLKERTRSLVSLLMRVVFCSADVSMKLISLLTDLFSSAMVHTGPVETTGITPVKTEVSEDSKSLHMLTILRSVDELVLKTVSSTGALALDSFNTSPDDLSSLTKLVSLSLPYVYACCMLLAIMLALRVCPNKQLYYVTV